MLQQIQGGANKQLQRLEARLQRSRSVLLRLVLFPVILLCYLTIALVHSLSILFDSSNHTFQLLYQPDPKKGYTISYTDFIRRKQRVRWISATSFVATVLLSVLANSFITNVQPVYAATCNVNSSMSLDQAYIDTNSCQDFHVTANATITLSGNLDFVGSGGFYVDNTVTATLSGALNLTDSNDAVVINGTVRSAGGDTTGVNITAQTVTINGTGSINQSGRGCAGGTTVSQNGFGPDLTDADADLDSKECLQTRGGSGKSSRGGAAHVGPGGTASSAGNSQTTTYGSLVSPILNGSGGAAGSNTGEIGGNGGGVVRLDVVGTLTVNGPVTANGGGAPTGTSSGSGGGSGGSIYITAGTLAGSNNINANGGSGYQLGGGGSGGRIAIFYNTLSGFSLSNVTATKGAKGLGGTPGDGGTGSTFILDRLVDDGVGNLRVTSGIDFQTGVDFTRAGITFDNTSNLTCATGLGSLALGATGTLAMNGVSWKCATADTIDITANSWTTTNANTIDITKAGAIVTVDVGSDLTFNNLTLTSSGAGSASANGGLLIINEPSFAVNLVSSTLNTSVNIAATNINIDSSSAINANGKGCAGGPVASGSAADGSGLNVSFVCTASAGGYGKGNRGGAAHTSLGGTANAAGNAQFAVYGSDSAPVLFGSGGGGGNNTSEVGGAGGGRVRLDASGTLTVNGSISANGSAGANVSSGAGGGSGGSVYLTSGTLTGTATVTAAGGNGTFLGGGGSGGRIAVYYNTLDPSFNLANVTDTAGLKGNGGSPGNGGMGSTFILNRYTDDGVGDLRITTGLDFQSGGDYTRTNITMDNNSTLSCGTFATLNITATGTLAMNGVNMKCSTVDTLNLTAGTWTTSNTNTVNFDKNGSQANLDIANDLTLSNLTYTGGNAGTSAADGGLLTLNKKINVTLNSTVFNASVKFLNLKSLTMDSNSKLNANGKGCPGGPVGFGTPGNGYGLNGSNVCTQGSGAYGINNRGGAGHANGGGKANNVNNAQSTTYGSNTAPVLVGASGSGGANSGEIGGSGGGKVRVTVSGTSTINGSISASGANGANTSSGAGGGAGGSIYVTTGVISGIGTITAGGGNGLLEGGGGSGGRAALEYGTLTGFNTGNMTAGGGALGGGNATAGGAGTTFTKTLAVATTPTVTSPSAAATNQGRNLSITSSAYASDGALHTTSDWQISDDNTFSNSDCSSGHVVFCVLNSNNLESITVDSSSGTFQSALNGLNKLAPNTTYYVRVRHNNGAGNSTWSPSISFTTLANVAPNAPTNTVPTNAATNVSMNPTLTSTAYSDTDNDVHFASDWRVYEVSDCSGTPEWAANGSSSLTSIVLNSSNGTFGDALAGRTTLRAHTVYSFKVRHNDAYGGLSTFSSCTSFTTTNTAPTLGSSISDQNLNEDGSVTNAFNLNTYITDADFNDNGALTCAATNGLTPGLGTMTVNPDGSVDFALASNVNGSDTLQFSCQDAANASVLSNTVTITVAAENDAPSFTKGANQTVNEDAGAQTVAGWATAISKGPSDEAGQTLNFTVNNDNNTLFSAQPTVDVATGNLTYTPAANMNGSATVTIHLSDNGGTTNGGVDTSADQTFTITVNAVNDAPSFTKGANQIVNEDAGAQTVAGWATGMNKGPADESGQSLTFNASADNVSLFSSQPAINASNGNLTFTPAVNANGAATITVSISDNGGTANSGVDTSVTQTFTITISAINDAPSFTKGANQTVNEDAGAQTVAGWATALNKGASNESGQVLSFAASNDNNGLFAVQPTVSANGSLTFTPAANANGAATITIHLSDDGGVANGGVDTSADQTFTITVNAVNDAPNFTTGVNVTRTEDSGAQSLSSWATNISAGPSDELSQTVSFQVTNTNNALFSSQPTLTNNGTLSFTPATNQNGTATISIVANDNGGTTNGGVDIAAAQTATITITAVNDAPVLSFLADQSVAEGTTLRVAMRATDIEGDPIVLSVADPESNFSDQGVTVADLFVDQHDGNGTFTWTPGSTLIGDYKLTVIASDGTATSTIDAKITVEDSDQNPVFSGQLPVVSILSGTTTSQVFDLDDYFTDPEGEALTFGSTTPTVVTIDVDGDHKVSITAPADYVGSEQIIFTATDPLGQTAVSNSLEIVVNSDSETIDLAEVSHVRGSQTGAGQVLIIGTDGQVIANWQAYPVGGVIPRIGVASEQVLIYTVKNRSGSTMSVYGLNGNLQRKKRISPKVHWRKLAVGNLRGSSADDEIVTTTRRDHSLYFKVYSYHPRTKVFKLERRTFYQGMRSNDYAVTIAQKAVHIVNKNGKTVFDWKAY
jgi:VCBS repeat-containing protein